MLTFFLISIIATLTFWDIPNSPHFKFEGPSFFKGSAGALIIFDLTNKETYENAIEIYKQIKSVSGPIPFILIGDNYHVVKDQGRFIDHEETRLFAQKEGGIYIEISPMKIDVLEEAIIEFTRRIIESREP